MGRVQQPDVPLRSGRTSQGVYLFSTYLTAVNNSHTLGSFASPHSLLSLVRRWADYLSTQRGE